MKNRGKFLRVGAIIWSFCFFSYLEASSVHDVLCQRLKCANGKQPSYETVMQESMALAENPEVTDWYVKMFGGNLHPEKGQNPTELIKPPAIYTEKIENEENRNFFWNAFRSIAGNPIGRNLLYRILIEIGRANGVEDVIANLYSKDSFNNKVLKLRKNSLVLNVKWKQNEFSINPFKSKLSFNNNIYRIQYCKSCKGDCYNIGVMQSNINVDLFHEFLHWYHALRNPIRYYGEKSGFEMPMENLIRTHPFCRSFWGINEETSRSTLLKAIQIWNEHQEENFMDLEEIRTIIGFDKQNNYFEDSFGNYIPIFDKGDELSENFYRKVANLPFRFGHNSFNFSENRSVVERCLSWVNHFHSLESNLKLFKNPENKSNFLQKITNSLKYCSNKIFSPFKILKEYFLNFIMPHFSALYYTNVHL
ncbi:MAG: hypothetical protein LBS83_01640 [Holosporales bacterium]|jgi:hypothetical protein|nr:hypothetical protein [Holosporales bacterium]